jgi:hypothetical protein
MRQVVAFLLSKLPWADLVLALVSALSKRLAELWSIVYECVLRVQAEYAGAEGSMKFQAAKACILGRLQERGLTAKESVIHFLIEVAVQLLKLEKA